MFQFTHLPTCRYNAPHEKLEVISSKFIVYKELFYKYPYALRASIFKLRTPCAKHFYNKFPDKIGRVSPFGNRRITGVWLLPDEYRRHMRPSSAKQA